MRPPIQIVWFKRDLRVRDHAPLAQAALHPDLPVLPLYIAEPSLHAAPDFDSAHWTFLRQSLLDLRASLTALGQPLVVRTGEVIPVLEELRRHWDLRILWAHQETGNALTYARDLAVLRYAREHHLDFRELPSGGVIRRLRSRDGWSRRWEERMAAPPADPPARLLPLPIDPGPIPSLADLSLPPCRRSLAQPGGEATAHATLDSFLAGRGLRYHLEMSSPVTAFDSCSRLSPHLAYGTISTRLVVQRLRATLASTTNPDHRRALRAFDARLHWRDHFMQKLEDEPAIEHHNFVRGFDGLREPHFRSDFFDAWLAARTGYPMIDACLRSLAATGWINFRMRALLMSFAAYHLWLHWREPGLHLARLFVDYEPGIHWSQCQMQSGTTGINTLRIYNPTKQVLDHDPEGLFLRRWIPELRDTPTPLLATPWISPSSNPHYPPPIVDHATAVRQARARLAEFRRRPGVRDEIREVGRKHGSRKSAPATRRPRRSPTTPQLDLF